MKPDHLPPAVLHEDNHLLVLDKPACLPTMGTGPDEPGLVGWGRDYLRQRYQKPGNVFLGIVSRLDALVTGVIVVARTSKAAARLSEQFRERTVAKTYLALVGSHPPGAQPWTPAGTLRHHVWRDERRHRMAATSQADSPPADAQFAELDYRTLASSGDQHLIEVQLLTGRKHQIRVQLAAVGWPVIGDMKYESPARFPAGIGLHSWRLALDHPTRQNRLDWLAPLPGYWPDWAKKAASSQ